MVGALDSVRLPRLENKVVDLLKSDQKYVVLELSEITQINSDGIGLLVWIKKKVVEYGGKVFLCSISEKANYLIELLALDTIFTIYETEEEAKEAVLEALKGL